MFFTAEELGLCPEGSCRRKVATWAGCALLPLQRVDWKEGKWKGGTPIERMITSSVEAECGCELRK